MRITLILLLLLTLVDNLTLTPVHEYWFNMYNPKLYGNSSRWYYCKQKCLYFENYMPGTDFVVIKFSAPLRDTFSACYVKTATSYILWNKVTSNKWYSQYCGNDNTNWYAHKTFHVVSITGEGIGNEVTFLGTMSKLS